MLFIGVCLAPRYQCASVSVHPLAVQPFKQKADKGTGPCAMWYKHNRHQLKIFDLFIIWNHRVNRRVTGEHRGKKGRRAQGFVWRLRRKFKRSSYKVCYTIFHNYYKKLYMGKPLWCECHKGIYICKCLLKSCLKSSEYLPSSACSHKKNSSIDWIFSQQNAMLLTFTSFCSSNSSSSNYDPGKWRCSYDVSIRWHIWRRWLGAWLQNRKQNMD